MENEVLRREHKSDEDIAFELEQENVRNDLSYTELMKVEVQTVEK